MSCTKLHTKSCSTALSYSPWPVRKHEQRTSNVVTHHGGSQSKSRISIFLMILGLQSRIMNSTQKTGSQKHASITQMDAQCLGTSCITLVEHFCLPLFHLMCLCKTAHPVPQCCWSLGSFRCSNRSSNPPMLFTVRGTGPSSDDSIHCWEEEFTEVAGQDQMKDF